MNCDGCEIKNLMYRYAHLLDRGDLSGMAKLFRRGRVVAVDGAGKRSEAVGEDAVLRMYRSFVRLYPETGTPRTKHMTTNVMVAVDEDGQIATADSYALVFQSLEDFPLQPIIGVRYFDSFGRDRDGWLFTERRIESDQFGDLSRHLMQPVAGHP